MVDKAISNLFEHLFKMDTLSGHDTKEKILNVAEELFALHGFDSTSMREITGKAHVSLALVNYHFGSKENLLIALVEKHFSAINEERRRIYEALRRDFGDKPIPLETILRATIKPFSEKMHQTPQKIMGLVQINSHQIKNNPSFWTDMWRKHFSDITEWFVREIHLTLPSLSEDDIYFRFHFMIGCMLSSIANPDRLELISKDKIKIAESEDRYQEELIRFCINAFTD